MSVNKIFLFTAAHPDDIEFSCGGLISKIYQNNTIYFYIFTQGNYFSCALQRIYEASQIKKEYPNIKIIIDKYQDNNLLKQYNQKEIKIESIFNQINADYILTHYPYDIKYDHMAASLAIKDYAQKYNKKLFYYESYSIEERFFKPNYFIDFNWKQKKDLLLNFPSQFSEDTFDLAYCRALKNGKNNNMHYAEAYKIVN